MESWKETRTERGEGGGAGNGWVVVVVDLFDEIVQTLAVSGYGKCSTDRVPRSRPSPAASSATPVIADYGFYTFTCVNGIRAGKADERRANRVRGQGTVRVTMKLLIKLISRLARIACA